MLLFPDAAQPNFFDLAALAGTRFHAGDFVENSLRSYPALDITTALKRRAGVAYFDMPLVLSVVYASKQAAPRGEFLIELRSDKNRIAEIHLGHTHGQTRVTAGPVFDPPEAIVSCTLFALDLDPEDELTIDRLILSRQFDPEAAVPDYRASGEAYSYASRAALESNAAEMMAACYKDMLEIRADEGLCGNSGQDAILPFVIEYPKYRLPYIIGNLNGLYWYGLDPTLPLEHLTTANGMVAGDTIFDCGSHTGFVACAMAAISGPSTKILCFDPFPQNNYLTDLNSRFNHFNIEVANAGVGRETTTIMANNTHQITVAQQHVENKEYKIAALDDYYAARPTFLKIDVEGFELEALLGAQKILRDLHPRVYIELHPQFFDQTGASYRKIFDAFPPGRFDLYLQHAGNPRDSFEAHLDAQTHGNLFAVPK